MSKETTSSRFIVYALHHPDSDHVYIGLSTKGMKRPRQHGLPYFLRKCAHLPKTKWIKALRERGLEPDVVVLEECSSKSELNEAERFHILYLRSIGMRLLNLTDGGDGTIGLQFTDAHRAKISAANKGQKRSQEFCADASNRLRGRKRSARDCASISAGARVRWKAFSITEEGRRRMSEMSRKGWADPLAKEQRIAKFKAKVVSPETGAKISASLRGKRKSPEHAAKMAARWNDPAYRERVSRAMRGARTRKKLERPCQ